VVTRHDVAAQELTAWCRAALSSYKCPVEIRLVDALPLGPTGKVLKRELRARWAHGA
jgi:acyl-CoA synthetase (AMP-forming)/AMP-acid ligase II